MQDFEQQYKDFKNAVLGSIQSAFPIESKTRILKLNGIEIKDADVMDIRTQLKERMRAGSFTSPITAKLTLSEKGTKKVISSAKVRILNIPRMTPRGSYLIEGNEYQVPTQLRLRPGVFHRTKENGELESFINAAGFQAKILFDPEKVQFVFNIGTTNIKLIPLLKAFKVPDSEVAKALGQKTFEAASRVSRTSPAAELARLQKAMYGKAGTTAEETVDFMSTLKLDKRVTKKTLSGQDSINPRMLLESAARLVAINKGGDEDERDSLEFKSAHGLDDFVAEKYAKEMNGIKYKIIYNMDRVDDVKKLVNAQVFSKPVKTFFTTSSLSGLTDQTNPLNMIGETNKLTLIGDGGISNAQTLTDEARIVHPSHLGFIDVTHTPECFTPDAELFSSTGWIRADQVTMDTELLCDDMSYHTPTNVTKTHYEGKMYGVKSSKIGYLVTPNHRVEHCMSHYKNKDGKFNIKRADEVAGKNIHFRSAGRIVNEPSYANETFQLPSTAKKGNHEREFGSIDMVDWMDFLGWYISEGNTWKYTATITQTKPDQRVKIEKLLNKLPFSWSAGPNGFTICGKQLAYYLRDFGKSYDKFLPDYVWESSVEAKTALFTSLMDGDGCWKPEHMCYYTSSSRLANDVDRLATELGYATRTHVHQDNREERYLDMHIVSLGTKKYRQAMIRKGHHYTEDYSGEVCCPTVPGGLLFMRYNGGFPIWTGNSANIGAITHMAIGTQKKGKELYSRFIDAKTGKMVELRTDEAANASIGFADDFDGIKPKEKIFKASVKGKMKNVSKVDYILPSNKMMFGVATNLIPFTNSVHGNRAMMAAKHMEQTLTLEHNEAPLVQNEAANGKSFENVVAEQFDVKAKVSGTVTKVEKDNIVIGKVDHNIYDHYPTNTKVYLDHEPLVKVGDKVKEGQKIAELNSNKDGSFAIGTNLNVGFVAYKGQNFEDGIVITEHAAKKFTSQHLHNKKVTLDANSIMDKKKFIAMYPTMYTADQLKNIGDDGVIKKGSRVKHDEPIMLKLQKVEMTREDRIIAAFKKSAVKSMKNQSVDWHEDDVGEVIRVTSRPKQVEIQIKTKEPMKIGDKLAGRAGNKGTVVNIIPDKEALITETGRRIDVYMNPDGIPGRINPAQNIEVVAAKVAEKTGKTYMAKSFEGLDNIAEVEKEMKKYGIKDKEIVTDPTTGKQLDSPIQAGPMFFIKMDHPTRKKFSARDFGGYSMDEQPTSGKGQGGQSMDQLTIYGMLAHGAGENLREMSTIKSEKSEEFWNAYQSGLPLPSAKVPFIFDKFRAMLMASGANMEKKGDTLELKPLTEKQVLKLSNGELKNSSLLKAKDLSEEKGGLFDKKMSGGKSGSNWMHISLSEPIPMPMFEEAILSITGLRKVDFNGLIAGTSKWDKSLGVNETKGISGGKAIKAILDSINIDAEFIILTEKAKKAKPDDLNRINRKLRYIRALKINNMKASDYMTSKVPVIPPKFRPIAAQDNGSLIVSDANNLYKDVMEVSSQLTKIKDLPDSEKGELRKDLYTSYKALIGLGDSLTKKGSRDWRGFIKTIAGNSPKEGMFQAKMIKKRQDLSGRSTVVPEPDYGMDEVGIPEEMAWKMYRPHVLRSLVKHGYSPLEARDAIEKRNSAASKMLESEMKDRPTIMNRAPSLHKFSVMAFNPRIVKGKAIKVNPLIVGGFNMDFDGDTVSMHVPVTDSAKQEAMGMLPSKHLLNPQTNQVEHTPSKQMLNGLYILTLPPLSLKPKAKFMTIQAMTSAYRAMKVKVRDIVVVYKTVDTVGRHLVNHAIPQQYRTKNMVLDGKTVKMILQRIAKESPKDYPAVVNKMKDLGNMAAYSYGTSVGISDYKLKDAKLIKLELNKMERSLMAAKDKDKWIAEFGIKNKVNDLLAKNFTDKTGLGLLRNSSLGGKKDAINQLVAGPLFVTDHNEKAVPVLIKSSYATGMKASDYMTTLAGARKGMMDRQLSTAKSGEFAKAVLNNVLGGRITELDCRTTDGIDYPTSESTIHLIDRYTTDGHLVTPQYLQNYKKTHRSIKLRSPITCKARNAPCSKCFGLREDGKLPELGVNIGVIAGQSLSEPSTQLTMKCSSGLIRSVNGIIPMSVYFQSAEFETEDGVDTASVIPNVIDKDGEVETIYAQRHMPHDDMYLVKTRSGASVLVQGNHPMWVTEDELRPGFSNRNTRLTGDNEYRCTSTTPRDFTSGDMHLIEKFARNVTREDAIWVDYSTLPGGDFVPEIDPYVAGFFAAEGSFRVGNGTDKYTGVKVASIFSIHNTTPWWNNEKIGAKLGVKYCQSQFAYTVYGLEFAESLSNVVGYSSDVHRAHNKVLRIDVESLSAEWAQRFLEAYIDGDGHVFEVNGVTVAKTTSTSWELTSQVIAICHKLGLKPSVMTTDGAPSRKELRTSFDVEIRFPESYKVIESVKLSIIKPMKHKYSPIKGFDTVTLVKKLNNWEGYVYDVKTATSGFMAGTMHNHNSFHSGGSIAGGTLTGFDAAKAMLEMPKIVRNKATLAPESGSVSTVKKAPQGGWFITLNGKDIYALEKPTVFSGSMVKKGDKMTAGNVKPQELAELTSFSHTKKFLSDSISDAYESSGRTVRKNLIETAISLQVQHGQITDAGSSDHVAGDILPVNEIRFQNKTLKNKIKFNEVMNGIKQAPFNNTDFLARLNFNRIPNTILQGASQGWKSNIHGNNPIAGLAYGAEFQDEKRRGKSQFTDIFKKASAEDDFINGLT